MGKLKVTIEHGGGFNWPAAASVAVIGGIAVSGGASGLLSGLETGLIWVASVLSAAVAGGSYLMIRAMRGRRRHDYVKGIHGPTERDREIDQMAMLRREIIEARARRLEIERAKLIYGALGPGWMHGRPQEAAPRHLDGTECLVRDPGHE